MPAAAEVAQDMPTRLRKSREAVKDAKSAYDLRLTHWKGLIREAIDEHGMSQLEVAKLAGVAKGRISAILAEPDDD